MQHTYQAPAVIEIGSFSQDTGNTGIRNGEEWWWPFDEWH